MLEPFQIEIDVTYFFVVYSVCHCAKENIERHVTSQYLHGVHKADLLEGMQISQFANRIHHTPVALRCNPGQTS